MSETKAHRPAAARAEKCEMCSRPKPKHTEAEAAYCIVRLIAELTDSPVFVSGP